ncbi:hypothetical protein JCM10908_002235 [Rhodotorula pacifica]|uniref:uncharacterized protein n=1 Tax=Rhodotorula pacifica TaxID=1495444 RepID=UPI0031763F32
MAPSSKQQAKAPAQEEEPVDPLHDASLADLEDEITTGPAANWEVAYVWSFLERFTPLVDYHVTNPVLPNVMAFEQALLESSPPAEAFAAAAAVGVSNPTRTSARLEEAETKKQAPLTAVAFRNAAAEGTNGADAGATNGNGIGVVSGGADKQQSRSESPASSLSSLTASESGADSGAGGAPSQQDEVAHLASIKAVETATLSSPLEVVPPVLPAETPCPPHSEILKSIVEAFIENLRPIKELSEYHGKKTWFHFLINFVTYRFNADPYYRGGFRWETNLLRTRGLKPGQEKEDKWWKLRWEDKIHLLRQMVDFQLTSSPAVRDLIKEQYDIGNQRNARRDPSENALVVVPSGRTSTHANLFHLDSSPRLYACGNLYKDDSPWIAVSSTMKGYKAFLLTLREPTKAERQAVGLSEKEAQELLETEREEQEAAVAVKAKAAKGPVAKAAAAAAATGKGKGKEKGKGEAKEGGEDWYKEERMTRARLEADFKEMAIYEKHLAALEARRMRASERAARNLSRSFNAPAPTTTRSSRLRAREANIYGINYNESDFGSSVAGDEDADGGEGRRKRRRLDADGEGDGNGNDSRRSSVAPSEAEAATGRRASGRQMPAATPGERRSSRLQPQAAVEPEEPEPEAGESSGVDSKGTEVNGTSALEKESKPAGGVEAPKPQENGVKKEEEKEDGKSEPLPALNGGAAAQEGSTIPATPEEPEKKQEEEKEAKPMEGVEPSAPTVSAPSTEAA